MRIVRGFYNEQNNTVNVVHYDTNHIIVLIVGNGSRSSNHSDSQGKMDALAIEDPVEYVRLMLSGEMQVWLMALVNLSVW